MLDGKSFTAVIWLHAHHLTGKECGYSVATVSGDDIEFDMLKRLVQNEDTDKNLAEVMPLCEPYYRGVELQFWYEMKFTYAHESDGSTAVDIEVIRRLPDMRDELECLGEI